MCLERLVTIFTSLRLTVILLAFTLRQNCSLGISTPSLLA
jgi:hypothetical protein